MKKTLASPNDYVFMYDDLLYVNQIDTSHPTGFETYWLTVYAGIQGQLRKYNSTMGLDKSVLVFEKELCLLQETPI